MSTAAQAVMERRRFLVLGGASVLGAHLSERLLDDGHEVIAVDDFTSGSFATIAHLKRRPRFAFVEHDVTTKFDVKVDGVFHLAVPSSERSCEADASRASLICVMGTANALEVAAQHGARVVMATSVERFGSGVRHAEDSALEADRKGLADVRIVRVATAYGPRTALDDGHVVTKLILEALRGAALVVAAEDASRVERLVYVDDAVDALVRAMNDGGAEREIVAPFVEATVEEIASAVLEVLIGGAHSSPLEEGIARTLHAIEERVASVRPPESGFFGDSVRADVGT
jgi:UDP-glucuronate decarboxylase